MKYIIALLLTACSCFGTTISGELYNPDGSGANGTLQLSLSQQGALLSTGGCGGPIQVLPNYTISIKVVNGVLQSPPTIYGNDCMAPAGTWYNVIFQDNNGNTVMNDRWQFTGTSIDIGTIVSVVITGTTASLGGGVVFTVPSSAQTVGQPGSTYLNVNNLNVTSILQGPAGLYCSNTSSTCAFGNAALFNGGLATGTGTNSQIYIGTGGNFFNRTFAGGDATCSGVTDGWQGIRTDTLTLETCIGGNVQKASLGNGTTLSVNGTQIVSSALNLTVNAGTFGSAITANGGIVVPSGTNSSIYIGGTGNLYLRPFSGADATCASVSDGWVALRTDTQQLEFCAGGVVYSTPVSSTTLTVNGTLVIDSGLNLINIQQATFASAATFNGGVIINSSGSINSSISIGTNGNLYLRSFSGADGNCTGVANGWIGIRTDTNQIEFCSGGSLVKK